MEDQDVILIIILRDLAKLLLGGGGQSFWCKKCDKNKNSRYLLYP